MASKTKTQPKKKSSAYLIGLIVAVVLAGLSIVEYYVAIHYASATILFLIAFIKGALVVYFFMHVYRLWRADDHIPADDAGGGH